MKRSDKTKALPAPPKCDGRLRIIDWGQGRRKQTRLSRKMDRWLKRHTPEFKRLLAERHDPRAKLVNESWVIREAVHYGLRDIIRRGAAAIGMI